MNPLNEFYFTECPDVHRQSRISFSYQLQKILRTIANEKEVMPKNDITSDNISCRVQSQTRTFAEIRTPERYLVSGFTIRNRITDSSQELIIRNRVTTRNPV